MATGSEESKGESPDQSEAEILKDMDATLKRMLNTPPKPQKSMPRRHSPGESKGRQKPNSR